MISRRRFWRWASPCPSSRSDFFRATIGFAVRLDGDSLRLVAAALLIGLGVILLAPELQARVAAAGGPISDRLSAAFGEGARGGMFGQFGVGLLLGAVWSPCVGPTLGASLVLIGALIVSGYDKTLETALVTASPEWLTQLTTRF